MTAETKQISVNIPSAKILQLSLNYVMVLPYIILYYILILYFSKPELVNVNSWACVRGKFWNTERRKHKKRLDPRSIHEEAFEPDWILSLLTNQVVENLYY